MMDKKVLDAIYEFLGDRIPDAEPGYDDAQRFGAVANRAYRWSNFDCVGVDVAWLDDEGIPDNINIPFVARKDGSEGYVYSIQINN